MDASDLLLDQWSQQVKEIFPGLHVYQQKTMALCVQGIIESGSAIMQRIAEKLHQTLGSQTKMVSYERRLQRFVANDRIEVPSCWKQFLDQVLPFWQNKQVTLILDMTPYTTESTIVYLGILVQSRVLPLAWQVMPQQETWDEGQWEILERLFDLIAPYLTSDLCTLLADRGLTCLALIKLCRRVGWHYVLRMKNEEFCRRKFRHFYRDWEQGKSFVKKRGDHWYGKVLMWKEHEEELWLSACWEEGYEEAWFLLSDRKASRERVREYGKRMRVESTFQDQKSRGYFMECSRFTNRVHLDRWLFVIFLAIWWAAHLGASCMHHGDRQQVDRKDRRDKGMLRIGHLWMQEILKRVNQALFRREKPTWVKAQLANCLPFSHRNQRLFFSIYLR